MTNNNNISNNKKKLWNTKFTQLFSSHHLRVPIMGAPMAGVSGGKLAAAACRAGAMGFIAAGHFNNEESRIHLEREIQIFREDTTSNNNSEVSSGAALLAIGFIGHSLCPKQFEQQVLQKHRPDVVQFFAPAVIHNFGTNNNIAIAKSYGAKVMAQIGTASEAQEAMDAGVDIIICQGSPEAGGHGVRLELGTGTLSLTSHVVAMVKQQQQQASSPAVVVLAAKGIVGGRGLAADLAFWV
mmetsp:Transcript_15054/g.22146  ORF Transcript_15054/g.22146 Transcript_15054/m.22146 type:complete len:240 (-) Transcript_15054:131-850(-)